MNNSHIPRSAALIETPASENLPHLQGMGRRQRRAAETRLRLFRCALQLFADRGFPNVTVEDITEAADVGKGTFFNYFESKDHVLGVMAEIQLGKVREAVTLAESGKQTIRSVLHHLLSSHRGGTRAQSRSCPRPDLFFSGERRRARADPPQHAPKAARCSPGLWPWGKSAERSTPRLKKEKVALQFQQAFMGTLLLWSLQGEPALQFWLEESFQHFWRAIAIHPNLRNQGARGTPALRLRAEAMKCNFRAVVILSLASPDLRYIQRGPEPRHRRLTASRCGMPFRRRCKPTSACLSPDTQIEEAEGTRMRRLSAALLPRCMLQSYANMQNRRPARVRDLASWRPRRWLDHFPITISRFYAEQNIVDLQSYRGWKASERALDASKMDYQDARDLIIHAIASLYLNAPSAAARVDAAQSRVTDSDALYKLAKDKHDAGTATGVDVLRSQVQLANDKQALLVAQNQYKQSLLALARNLGMSPGTPLELAEPLRYRVLDPASGRKPCALGAPRASRLPVACQPAPGIG